MGSRRKKKIHDRLLEAEPLPANPVPKQREGLLADDYGRDRNSVLFKGERPPSKEILARVESLKLSETRSDEERYRDRTLLAELYLMGFTYEDMVEEHHIRTGATYRLSPTMIGADLKTVRESWKNRMNMRIDEYKEQELAKIDRMERELWAAWRESRGYEESLTVKHTRLPLPGDEDYDGNEDWESAMKMEERVKRRSKKTGVAAYMKELRELIRLRMEILGVLETGNKTFFQFTFVPPVDANVKKNAEKVKEVSEGVDLHYTPLPESTEDGNTEEATGGDQDPPGVF